MKIAILSDIHGNQYAFDAVLEEIHKMKIKNIIVLGDIVGYYYRPDEILEKLKNFTLFMIKGNHENFLRKALFSKSALAEITKKYGKGIQEAIKRLSQSQIDMLINLPDTRIARIDNTNFLLSHGYPGSVNQYIYPDKNADKLQKSTELFFTDVILMGHTHRNLSYERNGVKVINPGSVGQNRGKGGIAEWVIYDTHEKKEVFFKTPYDISKLNSDIQTYDPDLNYLKEVLKR